MLLTDDTRGALESAVWLANSALEPDELPKLTDLVAFYDRFGYTGRRPSEDDLEPVRQIRPRLRSLFLAARDDAVPQVNAILAEATAVPRLVRHGDLDWHIHAIDDDQPLDERILVETAMAMIDLIRADELSRLGICAADDCDGIVLDLSRNRSRKFCSTACTNRAAVAAYRARKG